MNIEPLCGTLKWVLTFLSGGHKLTEDSIFIVHDVPIGNIIIATVWASSGLSSRRGEDWTAAKHVARIKGEDFL